MKEYIKKLSNATLNSINGLNVVIRREFAVKLEILSCIVLTPLIFEVATDALHRILLFGSLVLIIVCELFNTAIEKTIDRISLEQHQLSKQVKDIASSAVFVALLFTCVVWGWTVFEYFFGFEM
ncbi:MAG: diacylglycerol kinase [Legionellales bacterium]|nr:diacylglycerol kinase [Legionellales bacterium]